MNQDINSQGNTQDNDVRDIPKWERRYVWNRPTLPSVVLGVVPILILFGILFWLLLACGAWECGSYGRTGDGLVTGAALSKHGMSGSIGKRAACRCQKRPGSARRRG